VNLYSHPITSCCIDVYFHLITNCILSHITSVNCISYVNWSGYLVSSFTSREPLFL